MDSSIYGELTLLHYPDHVMHPLFSQAPLHIREILGQVSSSFLHIPTLLPQPLGERATSTGHRSCCQLDAQK